MASRSRSGAVRAAAALVESRTGNPGGQVPSHSSGGTLRSELERAIRSGRCVYCRRPASPTQPLTHEHVIPRAKGGTRRDASIIVPACARCNRRRGCNELVPFLLLQPSRIAAFLDYLVSLSPDGLRQMDDRVLAELYAAVWMLRESHHEGDAWRSRLKRLCSGRTLHRRRYAARRVVGAVGGRLEDLRDRGAAGPPLREAQNRVGNLAGASAESGPITEVDTRLVAVFALAWQVSEEVARSEIHKQHERVVRGAAWDAADGVVELDGWGTRSRKRLRVDRRQGRGTRVQGGARSTRGRAA